MKADKSIIVEGKLFRRGEEIPDVKEPEPEPEPEPELEVAELPKLGKKK